MPCQVQATRPLITRTNAILPAIAGNEIAARIANRGSAEFLDQFDDVLAETVFIGFGVARLIDAVVYAATQMLHERPEQSVVDRSYFKVIIDDESRFLQLPGLLSCECSDMCSPLIVVFNTARQRCAKYQKQSAHLLGSPVLRHRQSAVNVRSGYLIQPCTSVDIDNTMVVLSTQAPLSTTLSFSLFSTRHAVYDTAQERIRTFVSKTKRVPGQTRNPKGG